MTHYTFFVLFLSNDVKISGSNIACIVQHGYIFTIINEKQT